MKSTGVLPLSSMGFGSGPWLGAVNWVICVIEAFWALGEMVSGLALGPGEEQQAVGCRVLYDWVSFNLARSVCFCKGVSKSTTCFHLPYGI